MPDRDVLDAFRADVAPPADDVRARARARLLAATELPPRRDRGRRRWVVPGVATGAVAVALLLAVQPWDRSSEGVVARAAAAVSPTGDTVVHLRAVGHGLPPSFELWQVGTSGPFRIEAVGSLPTGTCTIESGFDFSARRESRWDPRFHRVDVQQIPANQLQNYRTFGVFTEVRRNLARGVFREDGAARIGSRAVIRLVPTSPPAGTHVVYYVDARTYAPVRWQLDRTRWYDVPVYQQLPVTPANLARTSVEAQHPDAPTHTGLGTPGCRAQ
jgi:hypothetical protein